MADYNLHGLNPRDFQHLVQAIAKKQIAAGVIPFGEGKDGGRDFSFRGKMIYPSLAAPWEGYLVGGCKFRQRPQSTKVDTDWAISQLESDLKQFTNKRRKLEPPDYYLFVTNVPLTPVPKVGGRARVENILKRYASKIGIKDFSVWDYHDLRGFLDGDGDIRKAFGLLITVGDVLALTAEGARLPKVEFVDVMHTFLQKELLGDTAAKLQFGGEDSDVRIPLASVFVDLPIADSIDGSNTPSDEPIPAMAVTTLLAAGGQILRGTAEDDRGTAFDRRKPRCVARFVIVGGPGQGKSTLGQYLCQIYRAAILQDRPKTRLDDRVPRIVRDLRNSSADAGGLPLTRRFPLRVELRAFSNAIAANHELTLRDYLRAEIAALGGYTLREEDFRTWLSTYPWLLVLDGLDEVPPSSNRNDVVRAIEHFRIDAASAESDMLILITTRPQSYSDDFPRNEFAHLYLRPLSPKQALAYGTKLAIARCGAEERRRHELLNSLSKACKNEATLKLMQSPLQVTIMATLLEETGEPPQQRYRLFAEYYRTIYRRETRRKLLGGILSERQTDIDTIHATAGLLLHAAGERTTAGNVAEDSALSDAQFRLIVKNRLAHLKVPEKKAADLLARITDGSLQRLVFLVRPIEGWVRFDIASFKEFMAAEALMTGPEEGIRERLNAIAPASYWRNVFLFAVGRCFVEREHMLASVVSLCALLNQERTAKNLLQSDVAGRASEAALWGSRLALDILLDGTAAQFPDYEVQFATIALELGKTGDAAACVALASVCHDDLNEIFRRFIVDRFGQSHFWQRIGAWYILLALTDREVGWASQILVDNWPEEVDYGKLLLFPGGYGNAQLVHSDRIITLIPSLSPTFLHQRLLRSYREGSGAIWSTPWKQIFAFMFRRDMMRVWNRSKWSDPFTAFRLAPVSTANEISAAFETQEFIHTEWDSYVSAARFSTAPTEDNLAIALQAIVENWKHARPPLRHVLPWPILACATAASDKAELEQFATKASIGEFGGPVQWKAAEERWKRDGLQDSDFETRDEDWPFSKSIDKRGFPFTACDISESRDVGTSTVALCSQRLQGISNLHLRGWLADHIIRSWDPHLEKDKPLSPQIYKSLIDTTSKSGVRIFWLDQVFGAGIALPISQAWLEILDTIGRENGWLASSAIPDEYLEELVHQFCANPSRWKGLLNPIVEFATEGSRCTIPRLVLETIRTWDAPASDSRVILSFTRDDLSDEEVTGLAQTIANHDSRNTLAWQSSRVAAVTHPDLGAKLSLALLRALPLDSEERWRTSENARASLVNYLRKRASTLDQAGRWNRLHLPPRV